MSYSLDIKVVDGQVVIDLPDHIAHDPAAILPALIRVTGHHVRDEEDGSESIGVAVFHAHPTEDGGLVHVLNANAGTYNDRRIPTDEGAQS